MHAEELYRKIEEYNKSRPWLLEMQQGTEGRNQSGEIKRLAIPAEWSAGRECTRLGHQAESVPEPPSQARVAEGPKPRMV